MRKVCALFIVALMATAASTAERVLAQDKATEVLNAMRQAIGGGRLDALRTFSLEAKTARNQGEMQLVTDVELYLDLPDRYLRVEHFTAPIARTMQMGFNGDQFIRPAGSGAAGGPMVMTHTMPAGGGGGGTMMVREMVVAGAAPPPGAGGAPTPEQQAMMNASLVRSQRVELSRLMLGWFGQAHPGLKATYTYAGEAESPDGKAHVIQIKADGGFDAKLFVDQATNMPLMLSYEAPQPVRITRPAAPAGAPVIAPGGGRARGGGAGMAASAPVPEDVQKQIDAARSAPPKMAEHRVYYGDWKDVDGIQFPHTLQRAIAGTTTEEWTIEKVKVNPKIDAKKFQ